MISVIFRSRNLPQLLSANAIISLIIVVLAIIIGVLSGSIVGVAAAVSVSYVLNYLVSNWILMKRALDGNLLMVLHNLLKPLLLSVVMTVALKLVIPFTDFSNPFLSLLSRGGVWLLVIFLFLVITRDFKEIRRLLK